MEDGGGGRGGRTGSSLSRNLDPRLSQSISDPSPLSAALYEFRVPESTELGSAVGLLRAMDADVGENAQMEYRIIGSDGPGVFDVATNRSTQEGVVLLRKVSQAAIASSLPSTPSGNAAELPFAAAALLR